MSSYTIDHKYGSRYASTKTAGELKYCNSLGVFNIEDNTWLRGDMKFIFECYAPTRVILIRCFWSVRHSQELNLRFYKLTNVFISAKTSVVNKTIHACWRVG